MGNMVLPLRRFADFSGRSRRTEFWLWFFLNCAIYAIFLIVLFVMSLAAAARAVQRSGYGALEKSDYSFLPGTGFGEALNSSIFLQEMGLSGLVVFSLLFLWWLATLVPNFAVAVRRLHDQDRSGALVLLAFVPLVGPCFLLFVHLFPGTEGPNRYGPDPRGPDLAATFG